MTGNPINTKQTKLEILKGMAQLIPSKEGDSPIEPKTPALNGSDIGRREKETNQGLKQLEKARQALEQKIKAGEIKIEVNELVDGLKKTQPILSGTSENKG